MTKRRKLMEDGSLSILDTASLMNLSKCICTQCLNETPPGNPIYAVFSSMMEGRGCKAYIRNIHVLAKSLPLGWDGCVERQAPFRDP